MVFHTYILGVCAHSLMVIEKLWFLFWLNTNTNFPHPLVSYNILVI